MVILGSTGSIGRHAQKVAKQFHIEIEALACGSNVALLNEQIQECKPKFVALFDESKAHLLEAQDCKVFLGEEGMCAMLELCESKKILNAIVGYAGLSLSLKILELGKKLILANKESLVVAGHVITQKIRAQHTQNKNSPDKNSKNTTIKSYNTQDTTHTENPILDSIFPVDSEHFSLYSLLAFDVEEGQNKSYKNVKNLYITASGGALRDMPLEKIPSATLDDVLRHPTWKMGQRITIDSATLVNKLYEILEAYWLFNTKNIDACIERSSLVHAFVEFHDSTFCAHIGHADMCLPLAYGMDSMQAKRHFSIMPLSLSDFVKIDFQPIDCARYPLWTYKDVLLEKPHLGIALNASNELLQTYFLDNRIPFSALWEVTMQVLEKLITTNAPQTLEEILAFRKEVVELARFFIKKCDNNEKL